uniref:ATP-dependent NAD(P)H-hydrate dehydratase n=1 Tax=Ditylenchus dipsaci TaxID=166011 RepID=A0A915DA46_9BILA
MTHSSLNQHQFSTAIKFSADDLKNSAQLFPKLTNELKKGDCGKVGVIGGSAEYTGAPYFAAWADLSYLFCHPDASPVIKGYGPELMVNPTLDFQQIEATLGRLDAVVFGPGIGRNKQVLVPLLEKTTIRFTNWKSNETP